MIDLSISLPESLHAFVLSRVSEGRFADPSEYIRMLIEADQRFQAQELARLREAAEAGKKELDRGEYFEYESTEQLLNDIVRRGEERLAKSRSKTA